MGLLKLLNSISLFSNPNSKKNRMNWNKLNAAEQLEEIKKESKERPVMIFKHSTTCPISTTSLSRMERNWKDEDSKNIKAYYVDLLSNRGLSAEIASTFAVEHQSPQVIVIKDGKSIYDESHFGISFKDVVKSV
ncbi:MAG: bacillithiol system protein YtxJ [Arcticibacterium sp.]|jgi:bacillithiol system protein YtxJ